MENQELFKQAILDAKAVRETAMAAARTTLAEHFEPFIKETMAQTLSEEEDTVDESMVDEYGDEHPIRTADAVKKEAPEMDEATLDEILAELDALSEDMKEEGDLEEGHVKSDGYDGKGGKGGTGYNEKAKASHGDHKLHEAEDNGKVQDVLDLIIDWASSGQGGDDSQGLMYGKDEIKAELSTLSPQEKQQLSAQLDDAIESSEGWTKNDVKLLNSLGLNITTSPNSSNENSSGLSEDMEAGEEGGDDQEVVDITVGDLKDIIRDVFMQLQGGDMTPEAPMDADTDLAADLGDEADKEISLDEILAELELEEKDLQDEAKKMKKESTGPGDIQDTLTNVSKTDYDLAKTELNEAVKTIKALKTELNEINLFSAKLLYVNKIFKAKNLNESQKTKVINAFDRAISVKEVENTYKTLLESLASETKKTSLKESVGFASKPIGNAPARPIVEADAFVSRWQQLAGIK